jgi:hypothetical protein
VLDTGVQWREVPDCSPNTKSNGGTSWHTSSSVSGKRDGKERFTGVYQAEDGTYKSAGTFDTPERALEMAEAEERHQRLPSVAQFQRVYEALPHPAAKVFARLGFPQVCATAK